MNSPKMRTVLLMAFLFVTSLVIAKAGLNWTRDDDSADEASMEAVDERMHEDHAQHLKRLRENEARLREHAEALAERIARDAERHAEKAERIARKAERMADQIDVRVHVDKIEADPQVRVEIGEDGYSYSYNYDYDYDYEYEYDFNFDVEDGDLGDLVMHEVFATTPGSDLQIQVPGADIQVVNGPSDKAEIFVFLDGMDAKKAEEYFSKLNFDVSSRDGNVYVTAESNSDWGWFGHGQGHITVRAQIPTQFNAELSTSGGDVTVSQLEGRLTLATSGGDIGLGGISGENIKVTTSGGDIEAAALRGPAKLTTSGGDIEIGAVDGPTVYVTTSGGDIEMGAAAGNEVTVKTSGGDIEMGALRARKAALKTSGGDIAAANVDSDLDASTSGGDINVQLIAARSVDLATTGGSIDIIAPRSIGADLDLDAGEVFLDGVSDFRGSQAEDRVEGSVNGGGPKIRARSHHGEVNLRMQ